MFPVGSLKSGALVLLLLISCLAKPAGRGPSSPESATVPVSQLNPETLPAEYSEELDWKDWSTAKNAWVKESFHPCVKQAGIRMSCGGCASIYARYVFSIDPDGSIRSMRKYKDQACGLPMTPELEKCLLQFYKDKRFPALKGRVFRGTLGNGLSC
ncbi:MAG: hypothetical protein JNM27_21135 [Leptospirales bacterium]|nr:hypothetical protein [Leptospirales bacterium]